MDATFVKSIDVRLEQPWNALSPMDVTFGKLIDVRREQYWNAPDPMDVTFGKSIDVRLEQPSNAEFPIDTTEDGIVILLSSAQLKNALSGILVIPSGITGFSEHSNSNCKLTSRI